MTIGGLRHLMTRFEPCVPGEPLIELLSHVFVAPSTRMHPVPSCRSSLPSFFLYIFSLHSDGTCPAHASGQSIYLPFFPTASRSRFS